jgi:hypothetical protein
MKLTTHVQLVPRSRTCGSIHPLPHMLSWRSPWLVKAQEQLHVSYLLHGVATQRTMLFKTLAEHPMPDNGCLLFECLCLRTKPKRWVKPRGAQWISSQEPREWCNNLSSRIRGIAVNRMGAYSSQLSFSGRVIPGDYEMGSPYSTVAKD